MLASAQRLEHALGGDEPGVARATTVAPGVEDQHVRLAELLQQRLRRTDGELPQLRCPTSASRGDEDPRT
jgi:hypothetical protein